MKCPHCFQQYDPYIRGNIVRKRRIENALSSTEKRKAKGIMSGPKPRIDKQKVFDLRKKGLSLRKIAKELKCSFHRVGQILKDES